MSIVYGLGNLTNEFLFEALDVSLPPQVIDQLNQKAGINTDNEFVFDHDGVSGRFGDSDGEMTWNGGENHATYENEVNNGGLTGVHRYTSKGRVEEFWADLFDVHTWETYDQVGEFSWEIDPVSYKAEFGWSDTKEGTSYLGNEATLTFDSELGVQVEADESSFSLKFTPEMSIVGVDDAKRNAPEMVSHVEHGDIDYSETFEIEIPEVADCQQYFEVFGASDECRINFKSSDLPMDIVLKMKNKFAFVKFGPVMAYVKSEDRKGKMVSFDQFMYLSFYVSENAGKPWPTIRRSYDKVGEDLKLTIPLAGALETEVGPAIMEYGMKWGSFFGNLFSNPPKSIVKAVYWMDKWVPSVQASTFDISDIVAATRIGCGSVPNDVVQQQFAAFADEMASAMKVHEFEFLGEAREFVDDVVGAQDEAEFMFVLPA